jgi:hypothetical protein
MQYLPAILIRIKTDIMLEHREGWRRANSYFVDNRIRVVQFLVILVIISNNKNKDMQ